MKIIIPKHQCQNTGPYGVPPYKDSFKISSLYHRVIFQGKVKPRHTVVTWQATLFLGRKIGQIAALVNLF